MRNIILIGFMGSGKTTLGKMLSDNYGYDFVDTDEHIVEQEKRSINDIFATEGEAYFRDLETAVVRDMIGTVTDSVISVGGGLPVREMNRVLLKELGLCVYLKTSKEELIRRLKGDKTRPLLAGDDLEGKIAELMNKRESLYVDAAELVVDTDGLSKSEIIKIIVEGSK